VPHHQFFASFKSTLPSSVLGALSIGSIFSKELMFPDSVLEVSTVPDKFLGAVLTTEEKKRSRIEWS
jgi:hypothetical protein